MAISAKCRTVLQQAATAAGRKIGEGKLRAISDGLDATMRELARRDPQAWQALPMDQRLRMAADEAMQRLTHQAALAEQRAALQARAGAALEADVGAQQAAWKGKLTRSQSYARVLENVNDYARGIRDEAFARLRDLWDATASRDGTGLMRNLGMRIFDLDNPAMTADVVREVFKKADGHTGNAPAKAGARAWLDTIEGLRQRFNAAGGDVGRLDYGYLAQHHDALRVMRAGADRWADDVLPLLDRRQYLDTAGQPLDEAALRGMLRSAWETLSSDGANKTEPGQFRGTGARANRGADHRVLHFKDGDAWMQYAERYGQGSLYDAMVGHVNRMARDVALIERMGPNPEATHRVQADIARRTDAPLGQTLREAKDSRAAGSTPDAYWNLISGKSGTPENRMLAYIGSTARNVQTAAKITWGPFAALADVGTVLQTLHYNKIPYLEMLRAYGRQFDKAHRDALKSHEVIAESLTHDVNRWAGDYLNPNLSGHVTNAVMKLSLMNAWTDAMRNAFSDVLMHNWTRQLGKPWDKLTEWDRFNLERKGITADDWAIITQAQPDPALRVPLLSAPAIRATGADGSAAAAAKWAAYVADEAEYAVVNPDLAARSMVTAGGEAAGTPKGELVRTVMQFKSFPLAMLTRHWRRAFDTPQGMEGAPAGFGAQTAAGATANHVATLAALALTTTLLGAIQTQSRQILSGKEPIDMTGEQGAKFWAKSFAAGGGAGFLADVLLAPTDDPSRAWGGHLGILGPTAGAIGGLVDVAKNQDHAAQGVRWISDQLPGVDMFWTRALYERAFLDNAQEWLNPGYLARMQARQRRAWGTEFWWEPGDVLPESGPSFADMVGR